MSRHSFCENDVIHVSEASDSNNNKYATVDRDRFGFQGGKNYIDPKVQTIDKRGLDQLRRRELKWQDMLEQWDSLMTSNYVKVRRRCRKGIPHAMRSRAWMYLSNCHRAREHWPDEYARCVQGEVEDAVLAQIHKDVPRQFPEHEMFQQARQGHSAVLSILRAFVVRHREIGYCQAQSALASALVITMNEEDAFWTFEVVCTRYLPKYFSGQLEAVQLDAKIFYALVKRHLPKVYRHLHKNNFNPTCCITQWFMCLYTTVFPWNTVMRILDMFFCEGRKVLFRVALAIFHVLFGSRAARKTYHDECEILQVLLNLPADLFEEEFLIRQSLTFCRITGTEMTYERQKQLNKISEEKAVSF